MSKPKVLYILPIHPCGMDWLREKYDVIVAGTEDKEQLMSMVEDVQVIVSRLTRVDADLMSRAKDLKAVAKHGVGPDCFDIEYCNLHRIPILTTGPANSLSVAEHAFFAMGALYKQIPLCDKEMRNGNWQIRDIARIRDITGKKLGIVGMGRIGSHLTRIATSAFNMEVKVFDPYLSDDAAGSQGVEKVDSIEELCRWSDILSLHVPISDETRNLISMKEMKIMRNDAIIINFARGGVVNEKDLCDAIREGEIAGAALDAFVNEPPAADDPLLQEGRIILSPHSAGICEDARMRMSMNLARGIDAVLQGTVPEFVYNRNEIYGS